MDCERTENKKTHASQKENADQPESSFHWSPPFFFSASLAFERARHTNYMNGLWAQSFSLPKAGNIFPGSSVVAEHASKRFQQFSGVPIETLFVHRIEHPRALSS